MGGGQLEAGDWSRRLTPPVQMMIFSAWSRSPLSVSIVCGSAKRAVPACSWTVTPSESICSRRSRMRAHVVDDLAHPREQPRIVEHRLAHGDAVATELAGFADQPGGMGQCPHRDGSVVGRHAAKLVAGYEGCAGAQVCRAERGNTPAGPAPMTMTSNIYDFPSTQGNGYPAFVLR